MSGPPRGLAWKLVLVTLGLALLVGWHDGRLPASDPWSAEARVAKMLGRAQEAARRGEVLVIIAGTSTLGWGMSRHTDPDRLSPMLDALWSGEHPPVRVIELTWTNLSLARMAGAWNSFLVLQPRLVVLHDELVYPPLSWAADGGFWARARWSATLPEEALPREGPDLPVLLGPADLEGPGGRIAARTIDAVGRRGGRVALVGAPRAKGAARFADAASQRARAEAVSALCARGATCLGAPEPWEDEAFYDTLHLREEHRDRYRRWLLTRLAALL